MAAHDAVVVALAPICADRFRAQGDAPAKIAELAKESSWARGSVVEKSGYALMPGKQDDRLRCRACLCRDAGDSADPQDLRVIYRSACGAERCRTSGKDNRLPTHAKVRAFLESAVKRRILFTYQELAKALDILPPHSIHQVTEALERLMEEDAAADRPFIAALAISKTRGGLPAPRFFDCAGRLGRFADGQDVTTFHAAELNAVFARWGSSRNN